MIPSAVNKSNTENIRTSEALHCFGCCNEFHKTLHIYGSSELVEVCQEQAQMQDMRDVRYGVVPQAYFKLMGWICGKNYDEKVLP